MSFSFPPALQKLIRELSKLPTIGEKSAARLAYHLVSTDRALASSLAEAIRSTVASISLCQQCYFLAEGPLCTICKNSGRDGSIICVVEKPMDLVAIERMQEFRGLYHVLHGLWAPMRGQGPESMKLQELVQRITTAAENQKPITEVILATSSTVEGDATALYVSRILNEKGIKTSRPAQGLPKGGELEYADEVTLSRAFSGRSVIGS